MPDLSFGSAPRGPGSEGTTTFKTRNAHLSKFPSSKVARLPAAAHDRRLSQSRDLAGRDRAPRRRGPVACWSSLVEEDNAIGPGGQTPTLWGVDTVRAPSGTMPHHPGTTQAATFVSGSLSPQEGGGPGSVWMFRRWKSVPPQHTGLPGTATFLGGIFAQFLPEVTLNRVLSRCVTEQGSS